ncbi:MAG: 4Fe-4S dicluster domain-containing protein [Candidatus Bathyarchaeia archaeon]
MQLIFHVDRCSGCHSCELICSVYKNGKIGPRRARIRIVTPEPGIHSFAEFCIQCANSPCVKSCPRNALIKSATGIICVDEEACIGCGLCMNVCPVNAIKIDPKNKKALICDLCKGKPKCVEFCPTKALEFMT